MAKQRVVRAAELAKLFDLSVEMVYRLTRDGVLKSKIVPGQQSQVYPFNDAVKAYIKHLKDKAANRSNVRDAQAEADLIKRELENRRLETKVALEEGRAYDESVVRAVLNDMLSTFKSRLWGFPHTAADRLVGIMNRDQAAEILRLEVADLCSLLTSFEDRQFYERHPEYDDEDDVEDDLDGDADDETADA